jgi:dTDP-4-dehydrorhamnose 3,5-epimerase
VKLVETPLAGVMVVEIEPARDERGYFLQTYSDELHELLPHIAEAAVSWNEAKGTLRGLHFQHAPHGEAKIVRCSRGAIYDVVLDVETGRWFAIELSRDNLRMLFISAGLAHGYLTLEKDTEVSYLLSAGYKPEAAGGVRWDDPAFRIDWPMQPVRLTERDRTWPYLNR